jgi:hypothetical protein
LAAAVLQIQTVLIRCSAPSLPLVEVKAAFPATQMVLLAVLAAVDQKELAQVAQAIRPALLRRKVLTVVTGPHHLMLTLVAGVAALLP